VWSRRSRGEDERAFMDGKLLGAGAVALVGVGLIMLKRAYGLDGARFRKFAKKAFDAVDADGSGALEPMEVYAAVLELYIKIVGVVKVTPPTRKTVLDLVASLDTNKDGVVQFDEFLNVAKFLVGNILSRVAVQAGVTFAFSPFIASKVVEGTKGAAVYDYLPESIVTTVLAIVMTTMIVPPVISTIDRFFRNTGKIANSSLKLKAN